MATTHFARIAALAAFSCYLWAQPAAERRTVIVISLDGFPGFALDDPKLPVPSLRRLAAAGSMARRMTTVNPTVTWPNHTAIVTGVDASRHGLLVNGTLTRTGAWPPVKLEPWIPKEQMVKAQTVYDAAHAAGLTTAQVDWVAIKSAPAITWEFPEVPSTDGTIEREMIARQQIDAESVQQFGKFNILRRDQIWTDAAIHILREHKPNLLLFHLLSLDATHHSYGPRSLAALDAMAFLDGSVSRLLDGVRAAGLADRTAIIVVSDHGFKQVKKQIHVNAALAEMHLQDKVYALPEGGLCLVYIDPKGAEETTATLRKQFASVEGIAEVAGPERYADLGLPDPARDPQMSGLVLIPKAGYAFSGSRGGPVSTTVVSSSGAHGYVNTDPEIDAIFIAAGSGIRRGVVLDRVRNIDVAPTIAALLGVKMPSNIQGRTLTEILQ
jgi:predicted AlkP superfamily pyrophosphatase or phosphodiesterase